MLPGEDVAVNVVDPVPAEPAVYGTSMFLSTFCTMDAVPIVGAPGRLPAVTELDAADVALPYSVEAVTVNVYAVPAVRPETRTGLDPVAVIPPGEDVTVYVTEPEVPVDPAVYVTSIFLSTFCTMTAVPIVGADGAIPMTSDALVSDALD
jgi:hypothetical protein